MRIHTTLLMGTALLGLVATGCSPEGDRYGAAQPTEDLATASLVERRIQNEMPGPAASNIDVQVAHGVATLTGNVPDENAKDKAEEVAKDVDGVERVENEITVAMNTGAGAAPDSRLGN